MKRYIIFEHIFKETYSTDTLTKEDLIGLKNRDCKAIIDTITGKYFDPEQNAWVEVKTIS